MSLEVTTLEEADDEESVSDASSCDNEDASSAGEIDDSDSKSDDSDDEEEDDDEVLEDAEAVEAESESEDELSEDESAASMPLDFFKNCDGPSDVAELESALQESKHDNAEESSVSSDDSDIDLQDPTLQWALLSDNTDLEPNLAIPNALTHAKRALSSSALLGPASSSAPNPTMLSPKRLCRYERANSDDDELPPELSIGQALYASNQKVSISDEDDEEQDRQLGEELREAESQQERENTPVPLLTPPGSPLRLEGDEEGDITVCEWPSNLAVDSAMTATMDLRPPSPENLQTWEQGEEERLMRSADNFLSPKPTPDQGSLSSTLTPMMRSISMEAEAPYLRL